MHSPFCSGAYALHLAASVPTACKVYLMYLGNHPTKGMHTRGKGKHIRPHACTSTWHAEAPQHTTATTKVCFCVVTNYGTGLLVAKTVLKSGERDLLCDHEQRYVLSHVLSHC